MHILVVCCLAIFLYLGNCISSEDGDYDDSFARYKMIGFAIASFSQDPASCIRNMNDTLFLRKITVKCDFANDTECSASLALDHHNKAIIISHRGSQHFMNVTDKVVEALYDEMESFVSGGNVSKHFKKAWSSVWNTALKDPFLTLKNTYQDYDIWITGYSLGGVMASLTAANIGALNYVSKDKIKVMTFGEPRVGDIDFVKGFNSVVGYSYRVIHQQDPVPHLPLNNTLNYQYTKEEVFYNNDMSLESSYTICPDPDDSKDCSDKFHNYTNTDHMLYFKNVSSIISSNCQELYS
uniref:Lipase_3 domain-containing protein n=1 Tax=Parastrongyloides trichosuri TaxID=131310 RepID=A0A0N4ZZX4_PARTI